MPSFRMAGIRVQCSGDDDDDNEWSWYEEDMQAASNNAWDNDAGDDMYRWG